MRMRRWKIVFACGNGPSSRARRWPGWQCVASATCASRYTRTHADGDGPPVCTSFMRMPIEHFQIHVEAVIDAGNITTDLQFLRYKQTSKPVIIFSIQAHQVREAARKNLLPGFKYRRHGRIIAFGLRATSLHIAADFALE